MMAYDEVTTSEALAEFHAGDGDIKCARCREYFAPDQLDEDDFCLYCQLESLWEDMPDSAAERAPVPGSSHRPH